MNPKPGHGGRKPLKMEMAMTGSADSGFGLGLRLRFRAYRVYPEAQNSSEALYSMVFGPKSLKI